MKNDPTYQDYVQRRLESFLERDPSVLNRIKRDVINSRPSIKLPAYFEWPEIVFEDILDAEYIDD